MVKLICCPRDRDIGPECGNTGPVADALERAAKPLPDAESAKAINSQVMYDSEFDPHPAVEVAWLVSGNEGFQKKLILGNDPYADDAFVELMDGVYPEDENFNAWADYEESLDDLYEPQNNLILESIGTPRNFVR